jgi:hypothetical protein
MSMSDILTEIKFGVSFAVTTQDIALAKFDVLARQKEKFARDLGVKIMQAKGWKMRPGGELAICEQTLYVFTPNELRDYVDAKLKQKLIDFSERI